VLRAAVFDFGNTLIGLDPRRTSARTDYADVVARPGAERLARHLTERKILPGDDGPEPFVNRFLEIRERNRRTADQTGREIDAVSSLAEALDDLGVGIPAAAAMRAAIRAYFAYEEGCLVALPGATKTLAFLRKRRVPLALLSNATDGPMVARVAGRVKLRKYFDPFVVSADVGVRKPRAEAFRAALERWSLSAESVAMIGDSLFHDVDGANRMGLYSIHLTQVPNPGDASHRGSIEPRLAVASHEALREALEPLVSVEA
jgi:HAD superfamily hydrolase (TIGR01549 family)